jgi:hypothetical protein
LSATGESDDWASEEFGAAALGDARLTQRLVALARRLAQSPQCSFPQSLDGAQLKAAYRFFDNPRIDTDGVPVNHLGQTLNRMQQVPGGSGAAGYDRIQPHASAGDAGTGPRHEQQSAGFMLHSLLAVTPEGLPLGVLGMKTWIRTPEESGKSKQRRKRPIEEKESVKWIEGLEHRVAENALPRHPHHRHLRPRRRRLRCVHRPSACGCYWPGTRSLEPPRRASARISVGRRCGRALCGRNGSAGADPQWKGADTCCAIDGALQGTPVASAA